MGTDEEECVKCQGVVVDGRRRSVVFGVVDLMMSCFEKVGDDDDTSYRTSLIFIG